MDRWKAELGKGREKRRVEESRSEKRKSQKKEDADARKGRKVAKHCVFQMICGSGGSKSRLAKAAGAEPCGQMRDEKVHTVVARSTFPSQNVQNTEGSDHFWTFRCCFAWQAQGIVHLVKVSKTWRFCSISKNHGRRGTFEEDLQRCIFRGRRSTKDMFMRDVRRSGRWFPEGGCILEHQIFRFAKMILRDRCSTSYDLASIFRGKRNTLDRWSGKIAKRIGTRLSALNLTFHFWRKSRRILSFLMLPTTKNEDVSQNRFVFDVVKFKYWGSLAELLRFWRCQVQTLRKSRRIAAFLILSSSKPEDVSQNSFVFKLADRQVDRQTGRQTDRQTDREIDS